MLNVFKKWTGHLSIKSKMSDEETGKVGCEHYQRKCALIVSTSLCLPVDRQNIMVRIGGTNHFM